MTDTELAEISDACLTWLAGDVAELERFMSLAGYSPQTLRQALGTTGLAQGLIDHFGRNEPLLLAMCANTGLDVNRVMRLWNRLNAHA
ncbi:DUF3572 family protein [Pelagibacterium limicola]|uniref:DUF3572 family protein n=1 Tax=Pelagibacterium limicola TaxID=2791022 RepID=UPI0018AF5B6E|nr:DUF3572 family protein [Pelagibacterium limicola]